MNHKSLWLAFVGAMVLLSVAVAQISAQGPQPRAPRAALGTAFTYQGQLKSGGNPVNGACDFQFSLWDAATSGTQIGTTQTATSVSVASGLFTLPLDFGTNAFNGEARWLEIGVRCPTGSGSYTTLTPRQPLTPAPYALALPGLYTEQNVTSPNLIGGYHGNSVTSNVVGATIGGGGASGSTNRVTDEFGTVGGGRSNRAGDNAGTTFDRSYATVGGGIGNIASGSSATVGGGDSNTAAGDYSFVVGRRAKNTDAAHDGVFIFADSTDADLTSTTANQFLIRASGGITMYTNSGMSVGVRVTPGGGSWSSISDRTLKENFAAVDSRTILG
ncbi:MAG: hypothetical protein N2559_08275, partial [Anaerolineae bacterium]|nr:hypothetical protein [Anaerolineae bacterium]